MTLIIDTLPEMIQQPLYLVGYIFLAITSIAIATAIGYLSGLLSYYIIKQYNEPKEDTKDVLTGFSAAIAGLGLFLASGPFAPLRLDRPNKPTYEYHVAQCLFGLAFFALGCLMVLQTVVITLSVYNHCIGAKGANDERPTTRAAIEKNIELS